MAEPTLQQLVERFRELAERTCTPHEAIERIGMAWKIAMHIVEHGLPSWQDRPTCAGLWADGEDEDIFYYDCGPWEWGRVFGPLPPDTQRKDGE
jgi:hypothetical protein